MMLSQLVMCCCSGKILLEFAKGSLPDTAIFGNLEQRLKPMSGEGPYLLHSIRDLWCKPWLQMQLTMAASPQIVP